MPVIRFYCLLLLLVTGQYPGAWAQNLIVNPDFEIFSFCPGNFSQLASATGWHDPNTATADFYNTCYTAFPGGVGIPINGMGYQHAQSGNGYAGIIVKEVRFPLYREYLHSQLTSPLIAGRSYLFEMYINMADSFNKACYNIGVLFTSSSIMTTNYNALLAYTPQIVANTFFTDQIEWTKFSAFYTATGNEQYITIGSFDTTASSFITTSGTGISNYYSYYFIDNLSLVNCEIPSAPNILGKDTNLCGHDSMSFLLDVSTVGADSYLWNTGDTSSLMYLNSPGKYWVEMTSGSCGYTDTIQIKNTPKNTVYMGPDTSLCNGTIYSLNVSKPKNIGYLWFNKSINPHYNVTVPGIYWVEVVDTAGCRARDSVTITYSPPPVNNFPADTVVCIPDSIKLDAGFPGSTYLWNTGSTDSMIYAGGTGSYWVNVNNKGCRKQFAVELLPSPLKPFDLGSDREICNGDVFSLDASGSNASVVEWHLPNGSIHKNPTIAIQDSGGYSVEVYAKGCRDLDSINVLVKPLPVVRLGNDTTLCDTASFLLDAENQGATYLWHEGSASRYFIAQTKGWHKVAVTLNGCTNKDSININYDPRPIFDLGNDTLLCEGNSVMLKVVVNGATYQWQNNPVFNASTFAVNTDGKYKVRVRLGACTVFDSIDVHYKTVEPFSLGNDTGLCFNDPVTLHAPQANVYYWNDGSSDSVFVVQKAGIYWVVVTRDLCQTSDTIEYNQKQLPLFDLGKDSMVCKRDSLLLDAKNPGSSYTWDDGSNRQQRSIMAPGIYYASVVNAEGCYFSDTVKIDTFPAPQLSLGNDTAFCLGSGYLIYPNMDYASYLWQDQSEQRTFFTNQTGTYWLTIHDSHNCSTTDSIHINIHPLPVIDIVPLLNRCNADTVIGPANGFASYLWQDGSTSQNYHVTDFGIYHLTVTDLNNCSSSASVEVVNNCPGYIFVPNAFTPNGDTHNDLFYPVPYQIRNMSWQLYNRWGELIFQSDEIGKGWNGTYKNDYAPIDDYVYIVNYTGINGKYGVLKGTVTLLR